VESFNGKMRDEPLNREQINTLREAQVLLDQWRRHYNTRRPTAHLGTNRLLLRQDWKPLFNLRLRDCHKRWYKHRGQVTYLGWALYRHH
jgi:hypothetical protein